MTRIKEPGDRGYFPESVTKDQAKDTGMALVLICLLLGYFGKFQNLSGLTIIILLVNMVFPSLFRPVAKLWLGLSNIMGTITSKVVLTAIFFIIVTPVGLIRRMAGMDSLQLRKWKKDDSSIFAVRDHTFKPEDLEHPY